MTGTGGAGTSGADGAATTGNGGTGAVGGDSVCGTADEGASITLTCPEGQIIESVTFASYGTPTGSCGSFEAGDCDAARREQQAAIDAAEAENRTEFVEALTQFQFGRPVRTPMPAP